MELYKDRKNQGAEAPIHTLILENRTEIQFCVTAVRRMSGINPQQGVAVKDQTRYRSAFGGQRQLGRGSDEALAVRRHAAASTAIQEFERQNRKNPDVRLVLCGSDVPEFHMRLLAYAAVQASKEPDSVPEGITTPTVLDQTERVTLMTCTPAEVIRLADNTTLSGDAAKVIPS